MAGTPDQLALGTANSWVPATRTKKVLTSRLSFAICFAPIFGVIRVILESCCVNRLGTLTPLKILTTI